MDSFHTANISQFSYQFFFGISLGHGLKAPSAHVKRKEKHRFQSNVDTLSKLILVDLFWKRPAARGCGLRSEQPVQLISIIFFESVQRVWAA